MTGGSHISSNRLLPLVAATMLALGSVIGDAGVAWAAPGDQLWVTRYEGPANVARESAVDLGVSPDGSVVFVTGRSPRSGGVPVYATAAYGASTGTKLWARRYNGQEKAGGEVAALGVSPDGSAVFVTGSSYGPPNDNSYGTVAYDASTGTELWVTLFHGPGNGNNDATALGVSPDGSVVFVTGESYGSTGPYNYVTVAYDASTGIQLWAARYNRPGVGNFDRPVALAVGPKGSKVFVTGYTSRWSDAYNYASLAYRAATGAELWAKRYNGPKDRDDYAVAVGVSPDGSAVFVTGGSYSRRRKDDYATLAYDASTGAELWVRRYNGTGNSFDSAAALDVSPDGSKVFVTGYSYGSTSYRDYATVAYDAETGSMRWIARYDGPTSDADDGSALGVSPDGSKVFVTGYSYGSMSIADYATVAYGAATGGQLWVTRYDGPGEGADYANALGVSPDGSKVFVTGQSYASTTNDDYATVAYDTT
jgi:hypothetical protein